MVQYLALACRVLIGLVFAASVLSKTHRPAAFVDFVGSVRALVPGSGRAAPALAAATAATELAVVTMLVPASTARPALAVAAALLLAFTAVLAAAISRGVTTPCRCFGASGPPGRPQLIRNVLLCLVAVGGAALVTDAAVDPAGAAVAVPVSLVAALLAVRADDVAVLFRSPRPRSQS